MEKAVDYRNLKKLQKREGESRKERGKKEKKKNQKKKKISKRGKKRTQKGPNDNNGCVTGIVWGYGIKRANLRLRGGEIKPNVKR